MGRVATPEAIAARATAGAILMIRRGSNGFGMMLSGPNASWRCRSVRQQVRGLCAGEIGERVHAGELHLVGDAGRADVERAAEQEREAQDVVHLVREVGPARGNDASPAAPPSPRPA